MKAPEEPPILRVKLVVDSLRAPAWVADTVQAIRAAGDVLLIDVSVVGSHDHVALPWIGRMLLRLYGRVDRLIFGQPGDADELVDLSDALSGIPRLGQSGSDEPSFDIELCLGTSRVRGLGPDGWAGGPLQPRFGSWSLRHGHGLPDGLRAERLGLSPGGPEMLTGRSYTITRLVADLLSAESQSIGQVVSAVDRLSLRRGGRGHLRKLPGLVVRALRDARMDGELPAIRAERAADGQTRRESLGIASIAVALAGVVGGFVGRRFLRALAPERWVVAVSRARQGEDGLRGVGQQAFAVLRAPSGREWADPFPLVVDGRELLFVEEYIRDLGRGSLAVVELDDSKRGWRSVRTVLERPTHLSYPLVFRWQDAWYLLPEQARTGSLELYRADSFPERWSWHSTLLRGVAAADATLAHIDGRWWLFAAVPVAPGTAADELHLFHAESPLGPWTAHSRNPVVSDVRTARPAGRLYESDGRWFRPAQDGAISYGHSIAILEIDRIDADHYAEHVAKTIQPTWLPNLIATHTFNEDAHLTVIDGLVREPRLHLGRSGAAQMANVRPRRRA